MLLLTINDCRNIQRRSDDRLMTDWCQKDVSVGCFCPGQGSASLCQCILVNIHSAGIISDSVWIWSELIMQRTMER